jgi:hypothetical protein
LTNAISALSQNLWIIGEVHMVNKDSVSCGLLNDQLPNKLFSARSHFFRLIFWGREGFLGWPFQVWNKEQKDPLLISFPFLMMGFQPVHTNAMIPTFSPPNLEILKCDIVDNLLSREKSTFKTINVKFYLFNELIKI